mgnify:FL=1
MFSFHYLLFPEGRWLLQGAVSWGSPKCDAGNTYSVFARISEFRDFIDRAMLPPPTSYPTSKLSLLGDFKNSHYKYHKNLLPKE